MTPKGFICVPTDGSVRYINVSHIIRYTETHEETYIQMIDYSFTTPLTCEELGKLIDEANGEPSPGHENGLESKGNRR